MTAPVAGLGDVLIAPNTKADNGSHRTLVFMAGASRSSANAAVLHADVPGRRPAILPPRAAEWTR
jgi:hypothetical protein